MDSEQRETIRAQLQSEDYKVIIAMVQLDAFGDDCAWVTFEQICAVRMVNLTADATRTALERLERLTVIERDDSNRFRGLMSTAELETLRRHTHLARRREYEHHIDVALRVIQRAIADESFRATLPPALTLVAGDVEMAIANLTDEEIVNARMALERAGTPALISVEDACVMTGLTPREILALPEIERRQIGSSWSITSASVFALRDAAVRRLIAERQKP